MFDELDSVVQPEQQETNHRHRRGDIRVPDEHDKDYVMGQHRKIFPGCHKLLIRPF